MYISSDIFRLRIRYTLDQISAFLGYFPEDSDFAAMRTLDLTKSSNTGRDKEIMKLVGRCTGLRELLLRFESSSLLREESCLVGQWPGKVVPKTIEEMNSERCPDQILLCGKFEDVVFCKVDSPVAIPLFSHLYPVFPPSIPL